MLPKDYLQWIVGADFSEEVKQIAREALQGKFPKRKDAANAIAE
jgi:DNA polymerase-3 subunit epsilon